MASREGMVVTTLDAFLPMSGSLTSNSSIDLSLKSSLSSCVTGMNSVNNSISDGNGSEAKTSEGKSSEYWKTFENEECGESPKSSLSRESSSSAVSDSNENSYSTFSIATNKPHKANDARWEAIQAVRMQDGALGLNHLSLLKKLGSGDIGSVYLAELQGTGCYFAIKVMDKVSLASRKKLLRAQTEREILQSLDHPFLPTLYTHFQTDKFSCLVMEFCSGGDMHMLRQQKPGRRFSEQETKFYAAEVLLALEYLHMLGIVYRDLKPENVLVRDDGHIMLSDFDLSLRCIVNPTLVKSATFGIDGSRRFPASLSRAACLRPTCIAPPCMRPPCFVPRMFPRRFKKNGKLRFEMGSQMRPLPELIAEPTGARSMSFVGTHEYLAPEIIKGEGHGSAVDWWTFGIFLYELLYGKTPFKGPGNRDTLINVVGQSLKFPESSSVSFTARDLIRGLLTKDPQRRLAFKRGATEIKQHPFFEGINWALIRSMPPPEVPEPFDFSMGSKATTSTTSSTDKKQGESDSTSSGSHFDFEVF